MAQEAGWRITFVDFSDSRSSLDALYSDDVDILLGMGKTAEREKLYLFSAKRMVTSYMTLMVRLDDERFTYGDIAHFNGMVTAIRNGSAALQNIYDACRRL